MGLGERVNKIWNDFKLGLAKGLVYGAGIGVLGCGGEGGGGTNPVVTGPVTTNQQGEADVNDTDGNPFRVIVKDEKDLTPLPDKRVYVVHHSEEVYTMDPLEEYIADFRILLSNPINLEVLLSNLNDRISDGLSEYKIAFHSGEINWTLGTERIATNVPLSQLADFYEQNESDSMVSILEVASKYWEIAAFAQELWEVREKVLENATMISQLIGLNPDEILYDIYRENTTGLLYHKRVDGAYDGRIACISTDIDVDDDDVCIVNADGTGFRKLVDKLDYEYNNGLTWFPDGKSLVYDSIWAHTYSDIYRFDIAGAIETNLTNTSTRSEWHPSVSPDMTQIAFVSYESDINHQDLYLMNPDGTGRQKLTTDLAENITSLAWSPDSSKLAFRFKLPTELDYELGVINRDGTGFRKITDNIVDDDCFRWSLDSSKLAYESEVPSHDNHHDIFISNVDGTGDINFTNNYWSDESPAWSPTGEELAFWSDRDVLADLYIQNTSNFSLRRLNASHMGGGTEDLAWSSNGRKLVFSTLSSTYNKDIYTISTDGTELINSTNTSDYSEWRPVWSP